MKEKKKINFKYISRKPFHPQRLHDLLSKKEFFGGVIESNGVAWIATRFVFFGDWKGDSEKFEINAGDVWMFQLLKGEHFKITKELKEQLENEKNEMINSKIWDENLGDMRQELNFVGYQDEFKEELIKKFLDDSLLTIEEMKIESDKWPTTFDDPFPQWINDEEEIGKKHNHDHDHDSQKLQTIPSESLYMRLIRGKKKQFLNSLSFSLSK